MTERSADGVVVLVIDDEAPMRSFLRASLMSHRYRVLEADSGQGGLEIAASQSPDVILLDLGLGDMEGVEVARRVREWSQAPIIVLSAREREKDKVEALDAGADDYLTKPFGMAELLARVRVALRRAGQSTSKVEPTFTMGDLRVDLSRRQVLRGDDEIHLTPIEYRLLTVLVRNAGRVVTHRQLLRDVWGPTAHETHYLRVYMGQLRQKLELNPSKPRYLVTESGVGYRLRDEVG
jgi:two-component system KDP operon response regulator KdpE